jgi:perosamine synthetase
MQYYGRHWSVHSQKLTDPLNIPIFNTFIHPLASKSVENVLTSTFVSEGNLVKDFENKLCDHFGIVHPVAVNSGTSALHLALVLAGIGEGDEVILPAQTFVASGLVILQQKAIPVFADIDYNTGNISPEAIEQKITPRTKAIMPVHWGGYPCDMDSINAIAIKNNLVVIEDAAHALGATHKGKPIGSISDFACFSFQAIKHLTTGDGGAVSCKSEEMYREAMTRRWFGINRKSATPSILGERQYNITDIGFKYHLNDYAASLGLANMNGFFERLKKRIEIADFYRSSLSRIQGIQLFDSSPDCKSAYWLFGFHVENRESFIRALKNKGIDSSVIHQRIDRNMVFGGLRRDLYNQEKFDGTQIHIPIHDSIDISKANYIIETIKTGW